MGWQDCEAASNLHPISLCPEGRQKPRIASREHQSGIALEDQDKQGQQHYAGRLSVQMTKVCFLSSLAYLFLLLRRILFGMLAIQRDDCPDKI
jgi:hypothetical protein